MILKKYAVLMALFVTSVFSVAQAQDATPVDTNPPIRTESTTNSTINSNTTSETTLRSPPPSAISPTINTANSDLCTFGVAGAIQTQILGISAGTQVRDMNCEMLKNAKTLYDMGMKVAAVSVMCQDKRVWNAMMMAGTPCPYDGLIGKEAKAAWESYEATKFGTKEPEEQETKKGLSDEKKTLLGSAGIGGLLLLLLL
jgi:hypothetical protein